MTKRNAVVPERAANEGDGGENERSAKYTSNYELSDSVKVVERKSSVDKLVKPALRGTSSFSPQPDNSRKVGISDEDVVKSHASQNAEEDTSPNRKRKRRLSFRDQAIPGNTLEDVTKLAVSHNDVYENLPEKVKLKRKLMAKTYCCGLMNKAMCIVLSGFFIFVAVLTIVSVIVLKLSE